MTDKIEPKTEFKEGVKLTWDSAGNCFVSMPVNSIPKKQFDSWIRQCKFEYSGKRWDMIMAEHLKAQAYDALMMTIPNKEDIPEEKNTNPLGLMNGGTD